MRFLAHSLATLGHETAASATTSITRKAAPLQGGNEKATKRQQLKKALLSDIGFIWSTLQDLVFSVGNTKRG
ncbi:hypothetical protein CU632_25405 [Escherichia coli]|uniref:Uncharacterized protein n=1 Tax=Escherichia coli TaxID=562 RepID=A0A3K0WJK1_ECOLX|nr:hypothetical protein [Salmonella enterica subsp. enterica serovar Saintpaul]EBX6338624.1 hypothetical protein [Salmonella enterica subsp. enterica serovar Typhimurium]EBX7526137.1 hypothetical protein [Salmonella enterica subsp. enterica serovar Kentucky]EBY0690264.1 hypothetical protein [Salmonella enterica subsp. enterica serovar Weltevreden]EBY0718591.1 hypothetical protein [Salmonella enterica subsp. enterica serovar Hadar]EBY1071687.1 hypothetical protein [Salmonella enterica subsp. en